MIINDFKPPSRASRFPTTTHHAARAVAKTKQSLKVLPEAVKKRKIPLLARTLLVIFVGSLLFGLISVETVKADVERTGSVTAYETTANNDTRSVTVPSDATIAIVGVSNWVASDTYISGGDVTINSDSMTVAEANTADQQSTIFYLQNPDTGTQTLEWDWEGSAAVDQGATIVIAFYKGVDANYPIKDSGGESTNGASSGTTGSLSADTGDMVVAMAGGEGTGASWTNATEQHDSLYNTNVGSYAEATPTGDVTVSVSMTDWVTISAVVLRSAQSDPFLAQEDNDECTSCTSMTGSFTNAPIAGNVLLAVFFARGSEPVSISTSGWTLVETQNDGSNDDTLEMWYRIADGTEGNNYVVTASITSDSGGNLLWISEWDGFDNPDLDVSAESTASTGSTRTSGTTATTTDANAWAIAAFSSRNNDHTTSSFSNSFTEVYDNNTSSGATASGLHAAQKTLTATGTQETTATFDSSARAMGIIAVFSPTGNGGETLITKITQEGYSFENDDGQPAAVNFSVAGVEQTGDPNASGITVDRPSTVEEGDLMITVRMEDYDATEPSFTTLSGWTSIGSVWGATGGTKIQAWYKVAGASEPSSYTWGSGFHSQIMVFELEGIDTSDIIDVSQFSADETFDTDLIAPSVDPTISDGILIAGVASPGPNDITVPSGMTLINDMNDETDAMNMSVAYEELTSDAATGTNTFGQVSSGVRSTGFQMVLNPEPTVEAATVVAGSEFSSGKTLSEVRQGERINLRTHISNSGSASVSENDDFALFYDRNDGMWSKVKSAEQAIVSDGSGCDDSTFQCEDIDAARAARPAVAYDLNGIPWIAYYDGSPRDLQVAHYVGAGGTGCDDTTAWTCETLDTTTWTDYADIAVGGDGSIWVSYTLGSSTDDLYVAEYVGASGTGCTSSAWTCTAVETSDAVFEDSSIAVDSQGKPYVAWNTTGDTLNVSEYVGSGGTGCNSSAWTCTTIVSNAEQAAIAIDPDGDPWVSYYETSASDLEVAEYVGSSGTGCTSSAWNCSSVDTSGDVGELSSIAFNPEGNPSIAYFDNASDNVNYATYVGSGGSGCADSSWECESVDSTSGDITTKRNGVSLAFGPGGVPWIAYVEDDEDVMVAYRDDVVTVGYTCTDADWTCRTIDNSHYSSQLFGPDVDIAFDADGRAAVVHVDTTTSPGGDEHLVFTTLNRGGEIQLSPSFTTDDGQIIKASHSDMTSPTDTTGRDDKDCLTTGYWNDGIYSSAEDINGVSLPPGDTNKQCTELVWTLNTAQAIPGTTYRFVVATNDNFDVGKSIWRGPVSVAADGYPELTIRDADASIYRYSKGVLEDFGADCGTDSEWACDDIDTSVTSGNYFASTPSIAIHPGTGRPWVAYFEGTTDDDLIVAEYVGSGGTGCSSAAWKCTDVDTDEAGEFTSLGFDQSGTAWVSYRANGAGDLRVATYVGEGGTGCASTAWKCIDILETDDVGYFSDIDFDSAGNPWIYYENSTDSEASIARFVGSGNGNGCGHADWTCEVIDSTADAGAYGAMEMSPDGVPWVAFAEQTGDDLIAAHWVGSGGSCSNDAWECYDVDVTNQVIDSNPDINFNKNGQAVIAYHYWSGNDVRYATFVGSGGDCDSLYGGDDAWDCEVVETTGNVLAGSVAMDSYGNPWISYRNDNDELHYARYVGSGGSGCSTSAWDNCAAIDTVWSGDNSDMAFDHNGTPWIVAYDNGGEINIAKMKSPPGSPSVTAPTTIGGRNSGSGDLQYLLNSGLAPYSDPYGTCGGLADLMGYCGVYTRDGQYDSITASQDEAPAYYASTRYESNTELPTASIQFKSSISPATQNVTLEVYRFGTTNSWETVQTYNTAGCVTANCYFQTHPSGTPSEYYESDGSDYWVHYRLIQESSSSSETTLYIDSFRAEQPSKQLRGGRVFRENQTDPLTWR